jgi:uncharacterized protein YxjI
MRYMMKQKMWSLADTFTIKNEQGEDVASVVGQVMSFGDKLTFYDVQNNELAFITQKLMSWGPTYEIYRSGELAAVVKQKLFTFMRTEFTIDVPGPDDLTAEGDFTDHEYFFVRGGNTVATVSKAWFQWTDTYGVELLDSEDAVLILASTVVIDMAASHHKD